MFAQYFTLFLVILVVIGACTSSPSSHGEMQREIDDDNWDNSCANPSGHNYCGD